MHLILCVPDCPTAPTSDVAAASGMYHSEWRGIREWERKWSQDKSMKTESIAQRVFAVFGDGIVASARSNASKSRVISMTQAKNAKLFVKLAKENLSSRGCLTDLSGAEWDLATGVAGVGALPKQDTGCPRPYV